MAIWGNKPSAPAPRPGFPTPSKLVMPWASKPAPKPDSKPLTKSSSFEPRTIKQEKGRMMWEAREGKLVIPDAGGKRLSPEQVKEFFGKSGFDYHKVGTALNTSEKTRLLQKMRHEDKGNIMSEKGRMRRVFEKRWGITKY